MYLPLGLRSVLYHVGVPIFPAAISNPGPDSRPSDLAKLVTRPPRPHPDENIRSGSGKDVCAGVRN